MTVHSTDQLKHDRVNLGRLVRRLENVIKQQNWDTTDKLDAWASATSIHSTVEYAKELLGRVQRVDGDDLDQDLSDRLEHLEQLTDGIRESLKVHQKRSQPLLSKLRTPKRSSALQDSEHSQSQPEAELLPAETPETSTAPILDIQQPQPPATRPTEANHVSRSIAVSGQSSTSTSLQTQDELSSQLAQMAAQLKRNALHFADSLEKEKGLVEVAQNKLEGNFTMMKSQRLRLRDHSGKSGSTTWMVLGAISCVVVAWVIMFVIIRLT